MRIADKMQYEQVKSNIGKNRSQMSDLQNQAATQKRVNKPSDDPLAASRVLSSRIDLQGNRQFGKSLAYAKSFLEFTDQSLGDMSEILMRAKELAINQSNDGSANEDTRRVVATEIEQLRNSLVAIGNRKLGDRFIFGGFKTQTAPFDSEGRYDGDAGEMLVHVDKESFLPMNVPGGRIFLGHGVSVDGMVKSSPPQATTIEELQMRGPASTGPATPNESPARSESPSSQRLDEPNQTAEEQGFQESGMNLFSLLRDFETALRTNDKEAVQTLLEPLDQALNQVVLARSQVGSRGMTLDNFIQTIEKQKVDNRSMISSLEDADVFATVSDINKTQSTLQATLETSGKMIQPSLLQFLR